MRTLESVPGTLHVLVADDEPILREAIALSLRSKGYHCAQAENGREAVEIARRCPPRVVLLDLMMPELDGFATARRLRADPRTRHAHILCLTARGDPAAGQEARRAGCELVLTKPFDCAELVDVIRITLNG